jgi:biopolymer transport protein ExbD
MQAAINITPLVDVVLVLLIIFMVMAPQMRKGPDVNLPNTTKPNSQGDERGRILVSIDDSGGLWINDQAVAAEHFDEPGPVSHACLNRDPRTASTSGRLVAFSRAGRRLRDR